MKHDEDLLFIGWICLQTAISCYLFSGIFIELDWLFFAIASVFALIGAFTIFIYLKGEK